MRYLQYSKCRWSSHLITVSQRCWWGSCGSAALYKQGWVWQYSESFLSSIHLLKPNTFNSPTEPYLEVVSSALRSWEAETPPCFMVTLKVNSCCLSQQDITSSPARGSGQTQQTDEQFLSVSRPTRPTSDYWKTKRSDFISSGLWLHSPAVQFDFARFCWNVLRR